MTDQPTPPLAEEPPMSATPPPPLTDEQLRDAVIAAITEDGLRPRDARQGLVEAMLAVVRPQLDQARAALAAESRLHGETVVDRDRDRAQDTADKLAAMIAAEDVIGEHSGMNDPWQNALDLYRELVPGGDGTLSDEIRRLRAERDQARADVERIRTREAEVRTVRRQALRDCDQAQDRLAAVEAVCAAAELQATRWEQPLPVPEWVAAIRTAATASGES